MVLLHGARGLAAVDPEAARKAFAEGLALAEALELDPRVLTVVLCEAVQLGAGADPEAAVALFRRIPSGSPDLHRSSAGQRLVDSLARSGQVEAAVELLEDLSLPAGGAMQVLQLTSDRALQRRALAAARERWRESRNQPLEFASHNFFFFPLFAQHWQKLEPADQESWLDESLLAIETSPDLPMTGRLGDQVELLSVRSMNLFRLLKVLAGLKPPAEVAATLSRYPDVEKAAKRYPLGMESVIAEQRAAATGAACGSGGPGGGMGFGGGQEGLAAATMAAHRGEPSAVRDILEEGHRLFRKDKDPDNPNCAPVAFWPSCRAYQAAMYWAGKLSGEGSESLLAEVPDTELALLASIELAAGTLGFPECGGAYMFHPRRRSKN